MNLTPHFTLEEFTRSATATANKISNTPSTAEIEWTKQLCINILEPLRKFLNRPIVITSGYRCPRLNTLVGGATNSKHMTGQAADIQITSKEEGKKIISHLKSNIFIHEALFEVSKSKGSYWVHISTAAEPKRYYNDNYQAI